MGRYSISILAGVAALLLAPAPALSQTPANIQFTYTSAVAISPVAITGGSVIGFGSAGVGSSATATLVITNRDTVAWTVASVSVSGQPFQVNNGASSALPAGQVAIYLLTFTPTIPGSLNGTLTVNLSSGTQTLSNVFSLNGVGQQASLSASYLLGDRQAPLTDSDTIAFPGTGVGQSSTALIIVSNSGNIFGNLTGVSLSGGSFRLVGLPALPVQIPAGSQVSFNVQFVPVAQQTATSSLQLFLGDRTIRVNLTGQGVGPSYVYQAAAGSSASPIVANGTVTLPSAAVGSTSNATITVQNTGTGSGQLSSIGVSGAGFSLSGLPGLPASIAAGQSLSFNVVFTATQNGPAQGRLVIDGVAFNLSATGLQANLITSYILTSTGNQVLLADKSAIEFPGTSAGQTSSATIVVANTGTAPGTLSSVALGAGPFRLAGLPLLPAQIAPGQDVRFTVLFAPTTSQGAASTLQIVLGNTIINASLTGLGTGPSFVYQATVGSVSDTVAANGTLALADTNVGSSSTATIVIQNTGNGPGQISSITIIGGGFQLSNLPVLPLTINPGGQAVSFNVVFTPAQSGAAQARLMVDSTIINLAGTGLGPAFSMSVIQGSITVPVADTGLVLFPNTAVGSRSSAVLQIANTGNVGTTLNSIGLNGEGFQLANLPPLPAAIGPGQNVRLTVVFAPAALGNNAGVLQINSLRLNLTGVGLAPPSLPAVTFGALADTAAPGQQPAIGVTLASPYPLPITGTLTLAFASSAFVDDPAIQFATGGRAVNFTIPANATQAVFGAVATQVQFQTGTVAGTITFTPSFSTGTVGITPSVPTIKTVTIPASVPQIRTVQIGAQTASSFEVVVTGFSTQRTLTGIDLQFTASSGVTLGTNTLSLDATNAFSAWYQSAASAPFGSQFSATLTINVNGSISAVQSVAVTARNPNGTSAPVSANLR